MGYMPKGVGQEADGITRMGSPNVGADTRGGLGRKPPTSTVEARHDLGKFRQ